MNRLIAEIQVSKSAGSFVGGTDEIQRKITSERVLESFAAWQVDQRVRGKIGTDDRIGTSEECKPSH
jgi:hypothetical protein